MKRIATILMCCFAVICANADTYVTISSRKTIDNQQKVRIPLKFEFYGKVGLNIMSADWNSFNFYYYDNENVSGKSKLGLDLTFGFMSHFRPSNPSNFYWGAELSLTQVGGGFDEYSYTANGDGHYTYPSCSFADWGVSIAPSIGWKKEIADDICLDLHFNPGIFCKFNKKRIEYTSEYYYNDTPHIYDNQHNIDGSYFRASFKGGIGVWYKRMNIDLSYKYLTDFESNYHIDYSNFTLSLGYRF